MTKNGIVYKKNSTCVHLDPKTVVSNGINFVSHAHSDHLPSKNGGKILSSLETNEIAKMRGFKMENVVDEIEDFTLINTGHILGAKGLLFEDVFYTGDICTRDRAFLKAATIPECKTLITECTFGLPEFVFPKIVEVTSQVNKIISELYSKGKPVILLGYQLGKAQTISSLFGHWKPLYYHDSVKKMNSLHIKFGINLENAIGHSEAEASGLLDKKPWVMIAPMMSNKNQFIKHMKEKYDAITIGFSGWAKSSRFAFGRSSDYSIPLSDHCDFYELVEMVKKTGAQKVYTIHGFVDEFALHLNKLGFDAQPLREQSLDDYV
ncbi:MAG: exonuclease [Nitrosopumilaceae archaeon]